MKLNTLQLICVLVITGALAACGSGSGSGSKIKDTIDENYQDYEIDEVRSAINSIIQSEKAPGMSIALIADNKIVYSEGLGVSNVESGEEVTADTSFWLGSVSKSVTGVALMQAQEQSVLSLDDHVSTLLANDSRVSVTLPHTYPLTLNQLVTHTSGITDANTYDCAYFVGDEFGEHFSLVNALLDDSMPNPVRILEQESVNTLTAPQISSGEGFDVGVFWVTLQLPSARFLVGHDGSDPGAYRYMFFGPEKLVGVVMIGNGDDEYSEGFNERHYELIDKLMDHAETLGDL